MGLSFGSTGSAAAQAARCGLSLQPRDVCIALAGNPNVGKSTLFNALTGLRQHTGNWPGKTVALAQGRHIHAGRSYVLVDLPGCYSLLSHSPEEEVARDFICFAQPQVTVVVCDAGCLERNLNLVLQTLEITGQVVVCLNLTDEAQRHGVQVDAARLEQELGVPVVCTCARSEEGLSQLMEAVSHMADHPPRPALQLHYAAPIRKAVEGLQALLPEDTLPNPHWCALRLLEGQEDLCRSICTRNSLFYPAMLRRAQTQLQSCGLQPEKAAEGVVQGLYRRAERLYAACVTVTPQPTQQRRLRVDRLLTSPGTGLLCMSLLFTLVLWITIVGANYPSQWLSAAFDWLEIRISSGLLALGAPLWLHDALIHGVYRVTAWVVSVMLPPMALFFPLFTLLEDVGYLPRVAFNLDKPFRCCGACGKQSLTTCMGLGCNAAGVVGCRIIDSPRERIIAILTNQFAPCNGRFPTLILLITVFFVGTGSSLSDSVLSALLLAGCLCLGLAATFGCSKLLSITLLRGQPSSFTLELPAYRRPQVGRIVVRSLYDRTLFVLGRAVMVAAPAGLLLYLLCNVEAGGLPLAQHICRALDPFARLMGLDGVLLTAFLLGFPANEIVLPIAAMLYLWQGTLLDVGTAELGQLLILQGWTWRTAICAILFSLMHWPCSTTLLTIYRETHSIKWTLVGLLLPTALGILCCMVVTAVTSWLGLA